MADNTFVTIPTVNGTGVGASVDTSALGPRKTVAINGAFTGSLVLEGSPDGTNWVAIALCAAPCLQEVIASVPFMRLRAFGVQGTPAVVVGALTATPEAIALPLPAAVGDVIDGAGAGVAALTLEPPLTLIVAGASFLGGVTIEASNDDVNWGPLMTFGGPQAEVVVAAASFLRARASNVRATSAGSIVAYAIANTNVVPGVPMTFGDFTCQSYQLT